MNIVLLNFEQLNVVPFKSVFFQENVLEITVRKKRR